MTELVLMRHESAVERGDPLCPADPDRPLTVRGASRAKVSARALRALGAAPQLILTSPFLRAVQTARIVASELSLATKRVKETDALLPDAAPEALWEELRRTRREVVLCVGHGPGLDAVLAAAFGTPLRAMWLKKGGAASLEVTLEPEVR